MGAYLSQPNTVKSSSNGGNQKMSFGFAAMQGWRVSMEDAHNCILELDDETAMFSVYDGHGGEEVALYCSKYLPDTIKEQKAYKDGKLQKALEDAFLAIDSRVTTEEVIKELVQIAGRPQEEAPNEKVAEEDDLDNEEAELLHEEATLTIEELLVRYGQNRNALKHKKLCPEGNKESGEGEPHSYGEKGINGEVEGEMDSNGKAKAGGGAGFSKLRACRRAGADSSSATGAAGSCEGEKDTGPSCSSSAAPAPGDTSSKFFEDSDESGEEEDGGSEEEVRWKNKPSGITVTLANPLPEELLGPGSDSGTTAVVALIRGKQLIVANAGDSRCVVSEKGKAIDMSYDHKPEDELELARIKNAGGKVTMDGRVNGGLNLSRAIGDHFYKRNKALGPEEQMISSMPDVKVLTLNPEHDFMVIACDGIWNVMSSQDVVDFVSQKIKPGASGVARPLSSIVEELLDHCLAPDTSGDGTGCDNMTCIIITFGAHPGNSMADITNKRKPEEIIPEKNGNDSKKSKSE
uniref:Protein phosphatase 1G n=1 Tax=Oncorhynchus kisutch TaxID=8019 RepID=A0A8C7N8N9_ONCKI